MANDPTTTDTTPPGAQPPDAPTNPPEQNAGSGQFAVWNHDLGQFVSGVSSKSDANAAKKSLAKAEHNGGPLEGHKLEVREV